MSSALLAERSPAIASPTTKKKPAPIHELLRRCSQRADLEFQGQIGASLTPRQYDVLVAIRDRGPGSQTDLVQHTSIDRSTLADIVRRMVRRGLLQRKRTKHDERMYRVELTDAGEELLKRNVAKARDADARTLGRLSAADRDTLRRLLTTIGEPRA